MPHEQRRSDEHDEVIDAVREDGHRDGVGRSHVPAIVAERHADREENDALEQKPEPGRDCRVQDGDGEKFGRDVENESEAHAQRGGEALGRVRGEDRIK